MKKYIYVISGLFTLFYLLSCNEDKGNYDYVTLAKAEIYEFDKIDSLTCEPEGRIQLSPKIEYTKGVGDDSYAYEWIYTIPGSNSVNPLYKSDESPDLDIEVPYKVVISASFDLYLKVINTTTGMEWVKKYYYQVKDKMQKGYLAISEKTNGMELDLIASFSESKIETLTAYHNVLHLKSSTYPTEGRKPLGIATFPDPTAPMPTDTAENRNRYSVFLLTDKSSDRVNARDYSYLEDYNISRISYIIPEYAPDLLIADKIRLAPAGIKGSQVYAYIGENWFFAPRVLASIDFIYPLNRYSNVDKTFKSSPYIGTNYTGSVLFNEDENCFMIQSYTTVDLMNKNRIPLWTMSKIADNQGDAFNFNNRDYRLVYMNNKSFVNLNSEIFAVVYNTSTSDYELLTFAMSNGRIKAGSRDRKIIPSNVDVKSIKYYAFNTSEPIIYMANEERLYVGLASGAIMSVKDITSQVNIPAGHKISVIKNIKSDKSSLRNLLIVATYDPANIDDSGVVQFFEMNSTTGNLTLAKHPATGDNQIDMKWDNFGKIIDIDYKEQ